MFHFAGRRNGSWPWQLASRHVRTGSAADPAAETTRALGEGTWRPSLNWLHVIELPGGMPLS